MTLAEVLALEPVPDAETKVFGIITKYSKATAEALTKPKDTPLGSLGQRLFGAKPPK